jgi:hypothetical protein
MHTSLKGTTASNALISMLKEMGSAVRCIDDGLGTYKVKSVTAAKEYFVDLPHRICSCLHFQIFHYCAHVLYLAQLQNDTTVESFVTSTMSLSTVHDINLDYWRRVGKEDDRSIHLSAEWAQLKFEDDSKIGVINSLVNTSQPFCVGVSMLRDMTRVMGTISTDLRPTIISLIQPVHSQLMNLFAEQRLMAKSESNHTGTRQPGDRIVHPLFPKKKKRGVKASGTDELLTDLPANTQTPKRKRQRKIPNIVNDVLSSSSTPPVNGERNTDVS